MRHHLLALLLLASSSLYAATGTIEGVRMPIWVEQDGVMSPLAPGMRLHATDVISTGEGGRLLLKLDDGAQIRLGENAKLTLIDLKPRHTALAVSNGAFRVKTAGSRKTVNIIAGSLAASGSAMSLWGNASDEHDAIALLAKGKVNVDHDNGSHVTLTRAKTFVDAVDGASLSTVAKASTSDYNRWIAQTDLQSGKGTAIRKGRWKVDLGAFQQLSEAESVKQDVEKEGYAVDLVSASNQGKTYWRPQLGHFKTQQDAAVIAEQLRNIFDTLTITIKSK